MDKNTLIGMGLMVLLIIGFTWMQPKPDHEAEARRQEQIKEQREREAMAEAERALVIDSIRPDEVANAAAIVEAVGQLAEQEGEAPARYNYTIDAVTLESSEGVVTGTVKVGDKTLTYEQVTQGQFPDSLTIQEKKEAVAALRGALTKGVQYQAFAPHLSGVEEVVTLANDSLTINISTRGGYINQATLAQRFTYLPGSEEKVDTQCVNIITPIERDYLALEFSTGTQRISTREMYFRPSLVNDSTVEMLLDFAGGAYWGFRYTLEKDSYLVHLTVIQNGMERILPKSVLSAQLTWSQRLGRNERGRTFEQQNSAIYYKQSGDTPDDLGMKHGDKTLSQGVQWIAFKNQFFSSILIPRNGNFNGARLVQTELENDPMYLKDMTATATVDYSTSDAEPLAFDYFIGPNSYPLLGKVDKQVDPDQDLQLSRVIPLGWSLFRWINTLIVIPVFTFLGKFISSYGLIIFLLTVFIKIILFPFTYKSYMSQARMRVLAPEIKEINEKYPGQENAMTRQQKTMALYSKAGASPMSGCLPMLLQMPILIAMFKFFPSCIELRGQSFLWAQDLAAPDYICTLPFTIPFYGNQVSLFCLLMTVTNILYARINMQNQPSQSSMPGMKWMMYLMPLMFLFFFNQYAAGLSYYYFLSLLITILQTYIFRRCVNEKKVRERMLANAAKPRKKSGFMARLEEAQRKQQAALREQQKRRR